jgi:hypothetical protein
MLGLWKWRPTSRRSMRLSPNCEHSENEGLSAYGILTSVILAVQQAALVWPPLSAEVLAPWRPCCARR